MSRRRDALPELVGWLAATLIVVLVSFPPLWLLLVGFVAVLLGPLWVAIVLWYMARAAILDLWRAVLARV